LNFFAHTGTTAEMKFMTYTGGYSLLDHRGNENTVVELKVHPTDTKSAQYK